MLAEKHASQGVASRVILLTDGSANVGITTPAKLKELVEGYVLQGMGLTTIALGLGADLTQLVGLAELGAGNFYFVSDAEDVHEIFTTEVKTTLYPMAVDVEIRVAMGPGYWLRAAYGTKSWSGDTKGGLAKIPALFLAKRQSSEDDIDEGRRGGGGGILLEAMPTFNPEDISENYRVGTVTFSYTDPSTGERLEQELEVTNPNLPGIIPEGGHFGTKTVEKGFVMLNIFMGLQMATEMAAGGDAGGAIGVLNALASGVSSWLGFHEDADIADDLDLIEIFVANLHNHGVTTEIVEPPEPWPND
jgi:Ca-activated chloride channel family protein